jgi:GNAT superfamily N-acetyltransferase
MSVALRQAAGADWAICRALLPEAFHASATLTAGLIALREPERRVAGAVVLHFDDIDVWMYLKVVHPERRNGIGSRLLREALEVAARKQARRANVVCDTAAEPAAEPFLLAHGFQAGKRFTTFEADFLSSVPVLQATRDRLMASHRVPASVRMTTVPHAPEAEVAQLCAEYIANRADLAHAPIRLDENLERWKYSPVVLVDGKAKAALLCEVAGDLAMVPGRMVAREFQGTWANALLLGMAADLCLTTPVRRFQFVAPPGNTDTFKLARRTGARAIAEQTKFERAIEP